MFDTLRNALAALAGIVCLGGLPLEAKAFDGMWRVGASTGRAGVSELYDAGCLVTEESGTSVGTYLGYGLSDMFDLNFELQYSGHQVRETDRYADLGTATVGVHYKFDVFRWIPYMGLLGGYGQVWGASPIGEMVSGPMGSFVLGVDRCIIPEFSVGLQVRDDVGLPFYSQYFATSLRLEYRWGIDE